jgi:hypothetical protein
MYIIYFLVILKYTTLKIEKIKLQIIALMLILINNKIINIIFKLN